jgi:hypothetical protein
MAEVRPALAQSQQRFEAIHLAVTGVTSQGNAMTALCGGMAETGVCDAGPSFLALRPGACGSPASCSLCWARERGKAEGMPNLAGRWRFCCFVNSDGTNRPRNPGLEDNHRRRLERG